jgi:hypothetical protein
MQIIKSTKNVAIKTGPVQFNDDWPGIFMSVGFVKHHVQPVEITQSISTPDMFARHFLVSFINDIYESLKDVSIIDDYEDVSNIQIIETDSFNDEFTRVDTGVVNIDGQIGYFVRGDMSGYISYLAKLINNPDHIYVVLQDLLSRSRI